MISLVVTTICYATPPRRFRLGHQTSRTHIQPHYRVFSVYFFFGFHTAITLLRTIDPITHCVCYVQLYITPMEGLFYIVDTCINSDTFYILTKKIKVCHHLVATCLFRNYRFHHSVLPLIRGGHHLIFSEQIRFRWNK